MKTHPAIERRELLALLAALGLGARTNAGAQDALVADPRAFRLVLENDSVRVLEYRSRPGFGVCGQGAHYHPDRVTVAMTAAKVRITDDQGRTAVRDVPAGHVFYAPAETHTVENIGGAGTRIYIIELKGKDWKPSTGTG